MSETVKKVITFLEWINLRIDPLIENERYKYRVDYLTGARAESSLEEISDLMADIEALLTPHLFKIEGRINADDLAHVLHERSGNIFTLVSKKSLPVVIKELRNYTSNQEDSGEIKLNLYYDPSKGISLLKSFPDTDTYNTRGARQKFIESLLRGDTWRQSQVTDNFGIKKPRNAKLQINQNFMKNIKVNKELIIPSDDGYRFNADAFNLPIL